MHNFRIDLAILIITLTISVISCDNGSRRTPKPGVTHIVPTSTPVLPPRVCLNVRDIYFDSVRVGGSEPKTVIIENCGPSRLQLSMIFIGVFNSLSPDAGHFHTTMATPSGSELDAYLSTGEKCYFHVWFRPQRQGDFRTQLNIVSNASEVEVVPLVGIGLPPGDLVRYSASTPGDIPSCLALSR